MLPDNALSTEPVKGQFLYPDNFNTSATEDYEMGGIALQNTSQGLQYQAWRGAWDELTGEVSLYPGILGTGIVIFTETDVKRFSFTFDQNMRWVATTLDSSDLLKFRWYDSSVGMYVTTSYSNIKSARLSLDDKRATQINLGQSDILLTYITAANTLCVRNQRERYLVEHVLETGLPTRLEITNFGMTDKERVQWRLQSRRDG